MLAKRMAALRAELLHTGRVAEATEDDFPLIYAVFGAFLEYRAEWTEFVQYLQLANKPEYREPRAATMCAPTRIYGHRCMLTPDLRLLEALRQTGAIQETGMSYSRCRLRFASERVLSWMCDYGIWLELYLFARIRQGGYADDVRHSAVLSWDDDPDDDDTINEIDVLAAKDSRLYLFSCKTGALTAAALNELGVLVTRFGGSAARGILTTTAQRASLPHAIVKRAESMGLLLLAQEDLAAERIDDSLKRIFQG